MFDGVRFRVFNVIDSVMDGVMDGVAFSNNGAIASVN